MKMTRLELKAENEKLRAQLADTTRTPLIEMRKRMEHAERLLSDYKRDGDARVVDLTRDYSELREKYAAALHEQKVLQHKCAVAYVVIKQLAEMI